ncbi:MAG: Gfo/Idh/MocA family protein [Bryobacteraceae bacterium]
MSASLPRREFLKTSAGLAAAPAVLAQRNVNDRLRVAMIGVGTRGIFLLNQVQESPNTEVTAICDLYEGNVRRAVKATTNKDVKLIREWEKAVSSPDIDAVVIATPDFWHAPMAIEAARNRKHIYVEKGLCRTLDEAKAIRKAVRENKVTLQLGHNQNSDPSYLKAKELYRTGRLGKVTLCRTYIDRTSEWPEWQFYTAYRIQQPPADANESTINWERFTANAVKRPFDRERFFRWRCWWEYGTGIAGDLMSHQWDGINGIMGMGIPESCQTQGALYFWKQDRDVPDQWHSIFEYPKQELTITFGCSFHNRHQGTNTYILGRDASLEVDGDTCRLYEAEWKPEYEAKLRKARRDAADRGKSKDDAVVPPDYELKPGEMQVTTHMRDWVDSIRAGAVPRCGMDRAFEEAVTIVMSVDAYFKQRTVKWDPVNEQIV